MGTKSQLFVVVQAKIDQFALFLPFSTLFSLFFPIFLCFPGFPCSPVALCSSLFLSVSPLLATFLPVTCFSFFVIILNPLSYPCGLLKIVATKSRIVPWRCALLAPYPSQKFWPGLHENRSMYSSQASCLNIQIARRYKQREVPCV